MRNIIKNFNLYFLFVKGYNYSSTTFHGTHDHEAGPSTTHAHDADTGE